MGKVYVYHHNDHDGIVAAGILYKYELKKYYKPEEIEFIMTDYNQDLYFGHIDFDKSDQVYFLDYSFSGRHNIAQFRKLLDRRNVPEDVTWIDHHKTSIDFCDSDDYGIWGVRCEGLCAAALTYLWCNSDDDGWLPYAILSNEEISQTFHADQNIPLYLKFIDDYDCWKRLYAMTNDFHYGLNISNALDDKTEALLEDNHESIVKLCEVGAQVQKYLKFDDKEYHVDMYGFEFTLPENHGGLRCFCLNRKGNSIMFGDKIKEYDAVIPFYFVNGKWKYSIFTDKDNVDCEAVAKSYGGGGHTKAAGWVSHEFIFNRIYNTSNLN